MRKYHLNELIFLIILSWLIITVPAEAQKGNPFLTHFHLPDGISNHNWEFEQSDNGLMFILNRKGIFIFDGLQWENPGISGRPVSIAFTDRLFYCTDKGVGYLHQNEHGSYDQTLILESGEKSYFYKFYKTADGLFAISPKTICLITTNKKLKIDTIYHYTYPGIYISDFFMLDQQMYFVNNFTDIYKFDPGSNPEIKATLTDGEDIVFSFIHEDQLFIGSSANKLYRFDGLTISTFSLRQDNYFNRSILNGGISVSSDEFALSTLNDGCIIINASDGSTVNILNYFNGLPDDEIFSLGMDNDGGLWISHSMGISRADLTIPIRSFSMYPGLRGNLFTSSEFNGRIYAGTSEGLYYLAEERNYRRISVPAEPAPPLLKTEQEPVESKKEKDQKKSEKKETDQEEFKKKEKEQEKQKKAGKEPGDTDQFEEEKGLLSRLFSRIIRNEIIEDEKEQPQEQPQEQYDKQPSDQLPDRPGKGPYYHSGEESDEHPGEKSTEQSSESPIDKKTPTGTRKIYQLQSINHSFKPVSGVRGKVHHLVEHNGVLYAATNLGLFQVHNKTATSIIRGKNIVFIEGSVLQNNALLIGTVEGAYLATRNGILWSVEPLLEDNNSLIISMIEIDEDRFLITTEFDLILLERNEDNQFDSIIIPVSGTEFRSPIARRINGEIKVFSSENAYVFNPETAQLISDYSFPLEKISAIAFYQREYTWFKTRSEWIPFTSCNDAVTVKSSLLNLLDNPNSIIVSDNGNIYSVSGYDQIYRISPVGTDDLERNIGLSLKRVRGFSGNLLNPENIRLEYANNALKIDISAPFYIKEGSVMFQYMISGLTERWSEWSGDPVLDFPFFPPGSYTIIIRARDILGNISDPLSIPFQIKPPFWQTTWFYIVAGIVVILLFILILIIRERSLKRDRDILEQKVRERTETIEVQKEVLEKQRDNLAKNNHEITKQKEEIERQRDQIFRQNQEITESITYASRIQSAVMPSKDIFNNLLREHFLIFRPRDIVSGDFYWMTRKNGKVVMAASDCTGHGVPGAFMSMLGVSYLNDIVNVAGITQPNLILNDLRQRIKSTLSQTGRINEANDGMDIAVCVFDTRGKNLQFAGAYNPLYLIRDGKLTEYKPDKMPVGIHIIEKDSFTLHKIKLIPGDKFYILSDGFADQFGGPMGKKFKVKPLKDLLLRTSSKSMDEQKKEIENTLDKWQSAHDQVDDILVIGFSLK